MAHPFATDTTTFDAAERIIIKSETCRLVDPHCTDIEIVGKSEDRAKVTSKDRTLKAVRRVVGERNGVIDLFEGDDNGNWAKDLLAPKAGIAGDVDQESR